MREQAGGQTHLGCLEHILALRLIIDLCKPKKQKLRILFVDFSKAYCRVLRGKMLDELKSIGCGVYSSR